MLSQLDAYVRAAYASSIGRTRCAVPTPALLLDLDVARRNIRTMAERLASLRARLRPHIKVHKCAELALIQVDAGAIGVCTATVWEAIVMSRSGVTDVLVANQVGGRDKIAALAAAACHATFTVAVDDARNASDLSAAACAAGSELAVIIEVDVGMGRGGVRNPEDAVTLARHIAQLPRLRFRGLQGYEGHCMLEPDPAVRARKAGAAIDHLGVTADLLAGAGFECEIVSAGGTGTYDVTGNHPRVTEIQAGSYVFMDGFHGSLVPGFQLALTVLGTVVIEHGRTIVLDSGRKSISIDFVTPNMVQYPEYPARFFAEEHALFDVDERCALSLGDTVELRPGYAPSTVNLYDAYHVVEGGVVTDIWPVIPRGPGHAGILEAVSRDFAR